MPLYKWSKTANANANADATVNYAEGQAPSSLNDSARAAMAALAMYRDDIAGAIVTGGTSTAYTLTSFSGFDSLADMNGQMIAFTPHATNGAGPVLLNVDSLGQKALRSAPNTELLAGVLIQGTPYVATYNNTDGAWYLQGFYGNPFNIPLAGGMDFWGTTVPNSCFAFPAGQAISRTTYAALFSIMGTTYGVGDGSTTFNLPDKTGRVSAMKEAAATRLTSSYFGGNSANMGATGGNESHVLPASEIPSLSGTISGTAVAGGLGQFVIGSGSIGFATAAVAGGAIFASTNGQFAGSSSAGVSGTASVNSSGGGNAHANVQPTIICNYIIRVL